MNVFGEFLDGKEPSLNAEERRRAAEDRRRAAEAWQLTGKEPAERLIAFDRWVRIELAARLDWGWAGDAKDKRLEQCRIALERVVIDLWRRGWLLDGQRLASRIAELLDQVGAYQRKGQVRDFWAYFNASLERHVGANAEEIQQEARRAGAHVNQALGAILLQGVRRQNPALPELIAQRADEIARAKEETLREKLARKRAQQAACKAAAGQAELF